MTENIKLDQVTYNLLDSIYNEGIKQAIIDYRNSESNYPIAVNCPYSRNELKLWWLRGYECQVKQNIISSRIFDKPKPDDKFT